MVPLLVLADANILVKDVVSFVLFDLAKANLIDLRWTPQIELEYAKHRARLRAEAGQRELSLEDFVWAQRRLLLIKKHLVPQHLPPGWNVQGHRLKLLQEDPSFAALLELPDSGDTHVALAAADWARSCASPVVLATDNLKDLPGAVLLPFGIYPLHPGDVLDLVHLADPDGLSASLLKTTADFKNPKFTLQDMLASIRSPQQFDNEALAANLAARWR
jgi:hypothetical protein